MKFDGILVVASEGVPNNEIHMIEIKADHYNYFDDFDRLLKVRKIVKHIWGNVGDKSR